MEPFSQYGGYIVRYSRMHGCWIITDKHHYIYCFHDKWQDVEECKNAREGLAKLNTVR